MSQSAVDLVIIGAGAAGLHVAQRAAQRGIGFEVFDAHARIGDPWRDRYRSLRLFTPRRWAGLPGMRLDIGYFEYPTGVQFADHLERYAAEYDLPVRLSTRVDALTTDGAGRFHLELSTGRTVLAERVVIATGAHQRPIVPRFAVELDPRIRQVHSLDYRGPEDLADGPVLVVGAGNSGTDIALESASSAHPTTISGRNPGQIPGRIDTPIGNLISGIFIRRLRNLTVDTEKGRRFREEHRGHGVNLVRNHLADLTAAGVRQVGRITGVRLGHPVLEDGASIEAETVVWCTGSRPRYEWADIPAAFDAHGWPVHERGLATAVPGLAFMGLPFQYSVASPTLMGMGRDAQYVIDHLVAADRAAASLSPRAA